MDKVIFHTGVATVIVFLIVSCSPTDPIKPPPPRERPGSEVESVDNNASDAPLPSAPSDDTPDLSIVSQNGTTLLVDVKTNYRPSGRTEIQKKLGVVYLVRKKYGEFHFVKHREIKNA